MPATFSLTNGSTDWRPALSALTNSDPNWLQQFGNMHSGTTAALQRAAAATTNPVGMCLQVVREWFNVPASAPTAIAAWEAASPQFQHNFYYPPAGVPVFYSGGSQGAGHVAMSIGYGMIRSTDQTGPGQVSTVSISQITKAWGLTYLGWTETLNGVRVYQIGQV